MSYKLTLALAGGARHVLGVHFTHFSCKLRLKQISSPPWGCMCTHCTPWLRLCTLVARRMQKCKSLTSVLLTGGYTISRWRQQPKSSGMTEIAWVSSRRSPKLPRLEADNSCCNINKFCYRLPAALPSEWLTGWWRSRNYLRRKMTSLN